MSPEQIARDVFDKLERERGVFHYSDKDELIRRFAQALLDAETRGLTTRPTPVGLMREMSEFLASHGMDDQTRLKGLDLIRELIAKDRRLVTDEELDKIMLEVDDNIQYIRDEKSGFITGFRKAEELRATRDVEAAFPTHDEFMDRFVRPQGNRDNPYSKGSAFEHGCGATFNWLKSELLSRLGGNKK